MMLAQQQQMSLDQRFAALTKAWKAETAFMSSITDAAMHPAYQEIIGMGDAAVPLILQELEQSPDQWFWALKAITGQDPVPSESQGCITEMARHWLKWRREHGYALVSS